MLRRMRGSGVLPKGALLFLTSALFSPRGICGDLNILTIWAVWGYRVTSYDERGAHRPTYWVGPRAYITCVNSFYSYMHPYECVALMHSVQHIGHHCVALRHICIRIDIQEFMYA